MGAFMKLGDIPGAARDKDHDGWIRVESLNSNIMRSIKEGAVDQERSQGDTSMGDIVVTRAMDKSSVKMAEACAKGEFFSEVEIHLCTKHDGLEKPVLKYTLENVIVTGYTFSGNDRMDPAPSETVNLGFTKITWTFVEYDSDDMSKVGQIAAEYNPATG